MRASVRKFLQEQGIDLDPVFLTTDQARLILVSMLQRTDVTAIEKSAIMLALVSMIGLKDKLKKERNVQSDSQGK